MDESRTQYRGCVPLIVIVVVLGLPLLYFLSSGPMFLLVEAGYLNGSIYQAIYSPLVNLCEAFPGFGQVWHHYLMLCGVDF